jgi:hypothetical protein
MVPTTRVAITIGRPFLVHKAGVMGVRVRCDIDRHLCGFVQIGCCGHRDHLPFHTIADCHQVHRPWVVGLKSIKLLLFHNHDFDPGGGLNFPGKLGHAIRAERLCSRTGSGYAQDQSAGIHFA